MGGGGGGVGGGGWGDGGRDNSVTQCTCMLEVGGA